MKVTSHSSSLPVLLQSSVMSVCFARFHPNLVVGGTYSGQIVLWDNRSHRRTPVQRTPLSAAAHTVRTKITSSLSLEEIISRAAKLCSHVCSAGCYTDKT